MKNTYLILIFMLSLSCSSQTKITKTNTESKSELKPPFSNQGEQEDYWTQELFKKEYKSENYNKYFGEIIIEKDNLIRFGKVQSIIVNETDLKYQFIFTNGLFHPDLLNDISLSISNLEELEFLSISPKVKRFRFWLSRPKMANPQVFVFELRNDKATEKTKWKNWVKGSKLTFMKAGWIVI